MLTSWEETCPAKYPSCHSWGHWQQGFLHVPLHMFFFLHGERSGTFAFIGNQCSPVGKGPSVPVPWPGGFPGPGRGGTGRGKLIVTETLTRYSSLSPSKLLIVVLSKVPSNCIDATAHVFAWRPIKSTLLIVLLLQNVYRFNPPCSSTGSLESQRPVNGLYGRAGYITMPVSSS